MQAKTARQEKTAKPRRKQIEAVVRKAKGDGKAHTVQDSIPFRNMFPDGLCRLEGGTFSKTIAFEDVNYRLASPEDQRDIFEHLCDFYNGYDPSIGVQMTLSRTCSASIPRGTTWTLSGRTRPGYYASSMSGAATAM